MVGGSGAGDSPYHLILGLSAGRIDVAGKAILILRVTVESRMLRWARERVGRSVEDFGNRFKKLTQWESGDAKPTLKQLEAYAKATYVPVGYFFLPEPPEERVPIPDLRTVRDEYRSAPSPNMLDTIYLCQQRQAWYREYALTDGLEPLKFVGGTKPSADISKVAARIRKSLKFDLAARGACRTWEDALRQFIEQVDDTGGTEGQKHDDKKPGQPAPDP